MKVDLADFVSRAAVGDQLAMHLPVFSWCVIAGEWQTGEGRGITIHVINGHWSFELELRLPLLASCRAFNFGSRWSVEVAAWRPGLKIQEVKLIGGCCTLRDPDEIRAGLQQLRRETR